MQQFFQDRDRLANQQVRAFLPPAPPPLRCFDSRACRFCQHRTPSPIHSKHHSAKHPNNNGAQLSSLKSAAQEFMDAVLTQLRERVAAERGAAGGSGSGSGSSADGGSGIDARQLRAKIEHAIEAMQEGLVERDTEVRLLVLAALAGEHILFVGPPGTAKSEVARRLSALVEGRYFERLLTRFSVPEARL
jgi:hypothetical protein